MSHPWLPQPYYATRQARLTAPVPQPLGFGSYTVGVFDDHVNMPTYMREPAGVSGFGVDASGCMPPQEVAATLFDVLVGVTSSVAIPSYVPKVGGQPLGPLLVKAKGPLIPLAADGVVFLARKTHEGPGAVHAAFRTWIRRNMKAVASQVLSVVGEAGLVNVVPQSAWDSIADKIVAQTPVNAFSEDNLPLSQVCMPATREMTEAEACANVCRQAQVVPAFKPACDACRPKATQLMPFLNIMSGRRLLSTGQSRMVTNVFDQQRIAAAAQQQALPPLPAAGGGRATPMLLGAAALAALLLLR